jgi:AcrR family transcriptional regulator
MMPVNALPNASARAPYSGHPKKRTALLTAAASLFLQQGYDATSVDQIARQAQVSKQTLYNHFGSKEDLFSGLLGHLVQKASVEEPTPGRPGPAREEAVAMLEGFADALLRDPVASLYRLAIEESRRHPQLGHLLHQQLEAPVESALLSILARHLPETPISERLQRTVMAIGTLKQALLWPLLLDPQSQPTDPGWAARMVLRVTEAVLHWPAEPPAARTPES